MRFNPPPGWPRPPAGWVPPKGWAPDPGWPPAPDGWSFWVDETGRPAAGTQPSRPSAQEAPRSPGPRPEQPAAPPIVPEGDRATLLARIAELETALAQARLAGSNAKVIELSDQQVLQDLGIYRYHHPLENAAGYKDLLHDLEAEMDVLLKSGRAVLAADMFTFSGSLAKGRRMVADLSKLMLRAYNAEADNCVRSLRSGNATTARKRLGSSVAAVEKLGAMMEMRINPDYHALRLRELELTADFQMKLQEEREEAREQRELLREQRKAEAELAAERERLEKERSHYLSALAALHARGDASAVEELSARLNQIDKAIEANDYRAANVRAGYVYVISNVGAFGSNVVKIGMTRRLEPMDRVRELGDASVPFPFDVHALYFSDDAVTLESQLHHAFAERRLNFVNARREFFFATPAEVKEILAAQAGGLLEYAEEPEAIQYFQSRSQWPELTPGPEM